MVDDAALRIRPAHPWTGVHTVLALACFVRQTVGIDRALGPAGHVGVAEILGDALTCSGPLSIGANGVLAAGSGVARVYNFCGCKG